MYDEPDIVKSMLATMCEGPDSRQYCYFLF